MAGNMQVSYQWAIDTCNKNNVGYSQTYRNQQTVNGITYYDCSSFIWYALLASGFDVVAAHGGQSWPFTTRDMVSVLDALGFNRVPVNDVWKPGDILVRNNQYGQHTEMVYEGRRTMGAHNSHLPLSEQVSINTGDSNPATWDTCHRFGGGAVGAKGSSAYVVAAICGNFWQESGINPGIWQNLNQSAFTDLLVGFGLGQWTNTEGDTHGRLYKLHEWLTNNGYADDDGVGQLNYLIHENVWYSTGEASAYKNLTEFLTSKSTDLAALTHAWNIGWEGIHDSSWDARVQYAQNCYDYIITHANDTSITTWAKGNRYLSEAERYNNAVLIYRFLSTGATPGTGTTFLIAILSKKKRRDRRNV